MSSLPSQSTQSSSRTRRLRALTPLAKTFGWLGLGLVLGVATACGGDPAATRGADATPQAQTAPVQQEPEALAWALALHGGTGTIERDGKDPEPYFQLLGEVLARGREMLDEGQAALEVVESLIVLMEDDPLLNAGRGSVLTDRGTHELHASIMDGRTRAAGSIAAVRNVRNPISLARRVMERSPHVLIAGTSADQFAREQDIRRAPQDYFTTPEKMQQWQSMRRAGAADRASTPVQNSVGVVALDRYGNLAAGSSAGGVMNQRYGRVDAAAVVGAGLYASNATAAIVTAGNGEELIRHSAAASIAVRLEHGSKELQDAADGLVREVLAEGTGGVVAVNRFGAIAMAFNTPGMFRAAANSTGRFDVGIWTEIRSGRGAD